MQASLLHAQVVRSPSASRQEFWPLLHFIWARDGGPISRLHLMTGFSHARISDAGIRSWSAGLTWWPTRSSQQTLPGLSTKSFCSVTVLGRCWRLRRWIGLSGGDPISDPAVLGLPL